MDVPHEVLYLIEFRDNVGLPVVVGDVACVKIESDMGMVELLHQVEHGRGVLRRAFGVSRVRS